MYVRLQAISCSLHVNLLAHQAIVHMQPSATHTNNQFKSTVDVTWEAPGDATSDVTMW